IASDALLLSRLKITDQLRGKRGRGRIFQRASAPQANDLSQRSHVPARGLTLSKLLQVAITNLTQRPRIRAHLKRLRPIEIAADFRFHDLPCSVLRRRQNSCSSRTFTILPAHIKAHIIAATWFVLIEFPLTPAGHYSETHLTPPSGSIMGSIIPKSIHKSKPLL